MHQLNRFLSVMLALAGCSASTGSGQQQAAQSEPGAGATMKEEWIPDGALFDGPEPEPEPAATMPTACDKKKGGICAVPKAFAEQLCDRKQPSVALKMFSKGSPWTRAYVRVRNVEAWYASKARRSQPKKLKLHEELIIIADRTEAQGGMKVSGFGSYDVVRWDGSCVSVMADEVALRPTGVPEVALIPWRKLDPKVRAALAKDRQIATRDDERKKECRADRFGKGCERARHKLSRMIAAYVRRGGEVPLVDEGR